MHMGLMSSGLHSACSLSKHLDVLEACLKGEQMNNDFLSFWVSKIVKLLSFLNGILKSVNKNAIWEEDAYFIREGWDLIVKLLGEAVALQLV